MSLGPDRFEAFFRALHDVPPFPWQQRLLEHVLAGKWPTSLALPTASGKTACIDIAIYALACGASSASRRIFFVVDRRVIVDEAYERALGIVHKLRGAKDGILSEVADALRRIAGATDPNDAPLAAFQLRGGTYRDDAWARTPAQPTVICSTVDQIGSRLLFRGYGVSPYAWPLHAGLAANDALILLDEAHCSHPFRQTLDAIARYRGWAQFPLLSPFTHVALSATQREANASASFALDEADCANPTLAARLRAHKPAQLIASKAKTSTQDFATEIVKQAKTLVDRGARRIGIIVNRVDGARRVYAALESVLNVPAEHRALLIGRMRPLDRDAVMRQWGPVFAVGAKRGDNTPRYAVATQCIEVGANLDFDALITECASLDALRQRFGRLFRVGTPTHVDIAAGPVSAVVMPAMAKSENDPIYGESLRNTWNWLQDHAADGVFDFCVQAMDAILPALPDARMAYLDELKLMPAAPEAAVMLPAHIDCWAQTSPAPWPEPAPALFLHGRQTAAPEVQVCWRTELDTLPYPQWPAAIALLPPSTAECLATPIGVLQKWIRGENAVGPLADVDTPDDDEQEEEFRERRYRCVGLLWRSPDDVRSLENEESWKLVRPGDTIVLPVSAKGWDALGAGPPHSQQPPAFDCGDEANLRSRARVVLRLLPTLLPQWPSIPELDALVALMSAEAEDDPDAGKIRSTIDAVLEGTQRELGDAPPPERLWLHVAVTHLRDHRYEIERHPAGGLMLFAKNILARHERDRLKLGWTQNDAFGTEDDAASFTNVAIKLKDHLQGVAAFAQRFAAVCGLPAAIVDDIRLAASLHDIGKADPRFQAWLQNGLPFPVARPYDELLAKSGGVSNAAGRRRAQQRAGYPEGGRHELLSVRLVESDPMRLADAHDAELVLHLIASHHGRCRPFAPVVKDKTPIEVSVDDGRPLNAVSETRLEQLDSGCAERFWNLVRRYGWWGLAYLEAVHVLADHRCSESEQRRGRHAS